MTPSLLDRLLYYGPDVLIIDKPAGIAVHKGCKTEDDLEQHFGPLSLGLPHPPRLAHRLDKDTSGCLVLSRTDLAATRLGALFSKGRVGKTYWAVVRGCPAGSSGRIDLALRKIAGPRGGRMETVADGQQAVTDWRLLGTNGPVSWLELSPRTGRTHQLRAHCAHALGCPIIGDPLYGPIESADVPVPRLHLHARHVTFHLDRDIAAAAPLPDHMVGMMIGLGFDPAAEPAYLPQPQADNAASM